MNGLRQTLALARREAGAFFAAPIAPVVAALFLVVEGFSFFAVVRVLSDPRRPAPYGAVLRTHFGGTFLYWAFIFFVIAALSMRLIAEERRQGTWEVLRTAPVSAAAIVTGKWLGALVSYLALWIPTLVYVALLAWLAPAEASPDWGPIASAYLGVAVTGASALAAGVLASALTRNQVVAAALTFVALLALLLCGIVPEIAPGLFGGHPALAGAAGALDVRQHMDDFARGIVDTRHLVAHAGGTLAALVAAAAAISVERRPRDLGPGLLATALALAAAMLGVVIAARHPLRLDATRAQVYTLDEKTHRILADLHVPVEVLVLTAGRPEFADLYDQVRELLARFRAASRSLHVETLDPALDPGRIGELAEELALSPEEVSGGGAVVLASGGRRRAVALLDMAAFTAEGGAGRLAWFRGEEVLAAALLEVSDPERPVVCFSTGHGELPLEAEEGNVDLSRLTAALLRDGVVSRPLASLAPVPASCAALAVVGPRRPLDDAEAAAVAEHLARGGRLLFAAGDALAGIEGALEREGVKLRSASVVDPEAELAPLVWGTLEGYGPHPISAAFRGRRLSIWHQPRWVQPLPGPGMVAVPLVSSSASGWAETSGDAGLRAPAARDDRDVPGPVPVAVAAERAKSGARVVVFGAARSFAAAELEKSGAANDALFASAISWLTGRTKLVGIGPKTPEQLRVTLTAAEEQRLFWLTVVLLPAAVGLGGALFAWRRRSKG